MEYESSHYIVNISRIIFGNDRQYIELRVRFVLMKKRQGTFFMGKLPFKPVHRRGLQPVFDC